MAQASHVLARKYRPQVFADLIGQDALVRTITNAIATNRLAHAYMLTGIRGVGKTSSARIIAKGLNCVGEDGQGGMTPNPCGKCPHCLAIANDSDIDVIEIDAASNTGVENVREIIEGAKYNPVSARFKIYIIDEVHMLSKQAFNALLKTLEEPPERVKFIFATTEIRKVPITILSRCQRFDLRRLDANLLAEHLKKIAIAEQVLFDEEALMLLARAGDGSVRDSLSLMDQAITQLDGHLTTAGVRQMLGLADRTVLFDLYEALLSGKINEALSLFSAQHEEGADPCELAQDLLKLTHWLTRIKITPDVANDVTVPEAERVRGKVFSEKLSMATLTACWQMLLKGVQEIRTADFPEQALEMLLIRLAYLSDIPSPMQLAEEIKKNSKIEPVVAVISSSKPPVSVSPVQVEEPVSKQDSPFHTLEEIVSFVRAQNERMLAFQLEHFVRPISIENGVIHCVITPDGNRDITAKLVQILNQKTKIKWLIQTHVSGGGQTIQEKKEAEQNKLLEKLKQTPIVQAVFKTFPNAKIEKVKPKKQQADAEPDTEILVEE